MASIKADKKAERKVGRREAKSSDKMSVDKIQRREPQWSHR